MREHDLLLSAAHITVKVTEGNLGLNHPELGEMARRVRVLGAECRSKGVDGRHGARVTVIEQDGWLGNEVTEQGVVTQEKLSTKTGSMSPRTNLTSSLSSWPDTGRYKGSEESEKSEKSKEIKERERVRADAINKRSRFCVKLARHGQVRGARKEILCVINGAVWRSREASLGRGPALQVVQVCLRLDK